MADANDLQILCQLFPRSKCHPLTGDRMGQWSVALKYPFVLLFEPANEPLPKLDDGGLDLERITAVRVLGVENYHG